jgi:hypothetical protein
MMVDHIVECFDQTELSIFMTELQWKNWLKEQIWKFPFFPSLNDIVNQNKQHEKDENSLSSEQLQDLMDLLSNYCEESLLTMNKMKKIILIISSVIAEPLSRAEIRAMNFAPLSFPDLVEPSWLTSEFSQFMTV